MNIEWAKSPADDKTLRNQLLNILLKQYVFSKSKRENRVSLLVVFMLM